MRSERLGVEGDDPRARRRAERIATSRTDILDAAEQVFAEKGLANGSLRDIAQASGFSTAAIYTYFENKQHLLADVLLRRAADLHERFATAAASVDDPLAKLHAIVDVAIEFFASYPHFRRLLNHGSGANDTLGLVIGELAHDEANLFLQILDLIAGIVRDGQRRGEIRDGNPTALTRLYMVLVNEHVVIAAGHEPVADALTDEQFHQLINGALRKPA